MLRHSSRIPFVSKQLYKFVFKANDNTVTPLTPSFITRFATYLFAKPNQTLAAWRCRSTTVLPCLSDDKFRVYKGKLWRIVFLSTWHSGSKLGSFAKTKQLALFRQKAARKKKPVVKNTYSQLTKNANIEKIKLVKSGMKSRSINNLVVDYETQLTSIN